ncbi:basigin precursor [Camelus ferus]|nr:basigin precursor [Camelus ferus]
MTVVPAQIMGHHGVKGDKVLKEDALPGLRTEYEVDLDDRPGQYSDVFLLEHAGGTCSEVKALPPPNFVALKLERATEGEMVVLGCKSDSFPPITNLLWYKDTCRKVITLRTRSCVSLPSGPSWGWVAEVLVLVTVIFLYEKRREPDEVLGDEDIGSAPLKSSGHHVNDKGKKVGQRHAG